MNQLAQGQCPALKFVITRFHHVPTHAKNPGSGVVGSSNLGKGLSAHLHDVLHVAEGLHVVDDRGAHVEAQHGRKIRRLDPRIGTLAFERFDQTGFLPTDISSGTAVDVNLQIVAAVEDVFTKEPCRLGLIDRLFQHLPASGKLAADVEVSQLHPVGKAAENHPLEELVGIFVDDLPIFEGAGLRLVRVADQVNRFGHLGGINKAPLHSRGKTGPTPAAQLALFYLLTNGIGSHREALL